MTYILWKYFRAQEFSEFQVKVNRINR